MQEVITKKKNIRAKLREILEYIASLFHDRKKLPEASEELKEELTNINDELKALMSNDSFENLKETYDKFKIGINPSGGLIAVEKSTGYVFEDTKFVTRVRFISLWRKSAYGNFDAKDEENCTKECFSDESKKIYTDIKEIIQKQLTKTGNIDTFELLNKMKNSDSKWGRVVSRRLFKTQAYSQTVYDFFRSITKNARKQTKPVESMLEALYGWREEEWAERLARKKLLQIQRKKV